MHARRAADRPGAPRRRPVAALARRRRAVRPALDSPRAASGGGGARRRFATAIGADDEIVLWNGGLWPWLDPETAIRAVARAGRAPPAASGSCSWAPRASCPPSARPSARRRSPPSSALLDRVVFFNDEWVPYEQRADWLLEADCAISTHEDHLETRFAFRTRLLDCFWARLPIVCTGGDDLGDVVERAAAGRDRRGGRRRRRRHGARGGVDAGRAGLRAAPRGGRGALHVGRGGRAAAAHARRAAAPPRPPAACSGPGRPRARRLPRGAARAQPGRRPRLAAAVSARSTPRGA